MSRATSVLVPILVLAGALAGCASERYVRETTQILSEDVVSLQRDLARYTQGQERNATRRINAVLRQREQREEVDEIVQAKLKQGDGTGVLHRDLLARARERIATESARADARAAERAALQKSQARLDTELARQLDELIEQLKELSSSLSVKDRAAFFVEYFKRTKKAVEAAQDAEAKP
jgi:hypothetical protein